MLSKYSKARMSKAASAFRRGPMNFRTIVSIVSSLLIAVLISACGGGGGGDSNGFSPADLRVNVTATTTSPAAGQNVDVTVRVTEANGALVADGTAVTATVSPAGLGNIVGIGPSGPNGSNISSTQGGIATFRFVGSGSGNVSATFSVTRGGSIFTGTLQFQVSPGIDRVTIQATTTTLPVNRFNVDPFFGSPFMAEVTVTVRTASGQLVNAVDGLAVSVNPVGNTGGFTTLDDPETEDDPATPEIENNEFLIRLGQGPVDITAGKSTLFLHSLNFTGQTTLTVTAQDPETLETISAQLVFNIVASTPALPAEVSVTATNFAQYITSSGGPTSGQFEILVTDAIGQNVPNPTSGSTAFNNVRVELIGDALGSRLSGISASGASVSGNTIGIRTTSGIAGAVLVSGDTPGNVRIRATSDRADNNVDNGISDPVFGERTVAISDGILFDLDITQPASVEVPVVSNEDGSYSAVVSVVATDRLGNPVLPGTTITFGLIDEPQQFGVGDFFLSGLDGNPQEGGTLFTAPGGAFLTAGGGAGPGDALVLFGENVVGNRDHESARRIASVSSQTSLTVERRFNHNDTTGSIVNSGPVLPYVIGRAADGNILASATTNVLGVAETIMDYPVSKLGKTVVVWAQGDGDIVSGMPETVGDAEFLTFAGIAPANLTADPATILGNTTAQVDVCITDQLGAGIGGIYVGFAFAGQSAGTLSVNGVAAPGTAPIPTSFGTGCVTLDVTTTGVLDGGDITFTGAGASDTVDVVVGTQILIARPSVFRGAGAYVVTLSLIDANNNPVAGVGLTGTCSATPASQQAATISTAPVAGENGFTDADGEAHFSIVVEGIDNLFAGGTPGSATCTFQTLLGPPSATVNILGDQECPDPMASPECPALGGP